MVTISNKSIGKKITFYNVIKIIVTAGHYIFQFDNGTTENFSKDFWGIDNYDDYVTIGYNLKSI